MQTLRTARLILSPPTIADAPVITKICQDPQIIRWTTLPSPYEPAHAEGFIEIVEQGWAQGSSPTWALRVPTLEGPSELVGMISLMDEGAGSAEIGFWLAPRARGQRLMDEAAAAVCEYGFERMGLERISWRARVGNYASAAVARRAGFRYEGTARRGLTQRGARHDGWLAGRLAGDGPLTDLLRAEAALTWPTPTAGAAGTASP